MDAPTLRQDSQDLSCRDAFSPLQKSPLVRAALQLSVPLADLPHGYKIRGVVHPRAALMRMGFADDVIAALHAIALIVTPLGMLHRVAEQTEFWPTPAAHLHRADQLSS